MSRHAASFLTRSLPADGARAAAWRGAAVFVAALALLASAFINVDSVRAAVAPTPVEDFVQQNVDKGYALLRNKSLSDAERHAQFHTFMLSVSDMRRIGMFALGQYANRVSKPDTDVYLVAFTDYAIPVYETWLSKYNDRTLKITGAVQRAPDDFVVSADAVSISDPTSQRYKITFRIRKAADGSFVVIDMAAEGISLALTLRSDFTAYLQQHGERLPDLISRLKGETSTINSGGAAKGAAR